LETTDVLVVGAGPTGLMLATELALAGVRCRVLDRRTDAPNTTRAFAVHARTLELLDARGMADELLPRGIPVREIAPAPGAVIDLGALDSRFPMILIAPQSGTEHVLERRARDLGVEIDRGAEVVGLRQDAQRVVVELEGGGAETAQYVVGCDGAHSAVRELLGVPFTGSEYATHIMLADVRLAAPPAEAMFAETGPQGAVIVVPFGDGWFRAIAWDREREQVPLDVPLPMTEVRDAFTRIAGTDFGMLEQRWSTRFLSERRQAAHYQVGRVLLAGDAAHVHSPLGGQGMNTGIGDAMNLGWKLGAAVHGWAPPWLLDSYETERHRVGKQVLVLTDTFNDLVLGRSAVRRFLQGQVVRLLVRVAPARRLLVGRLTGLGIAYPAGRHHHPWTGRRAPDVVCGPGRLYELLRDGRFVLVDSTPFGSVAPAVADAALVRTVQTRSAPGRADVLLVRPDGYVAWAADDGPDVTAQALAAVERWCGTPTAQPAGVAPRWRPRR
jgi:2-polyprenyl-6-methoxyphenol hydroxylase-like FAD-dependent oxidoreductase